MLNFEQRTEEVRFISGSKNFVLEEKETNASNPYQIIGNLVLDYFQKRIIAAEKMNEKLKRVLAL